MYRGQQIANLDTIRRQARHLDTTSCVGHSVGLSTFALTECFGNTKRKEYKNSQSQNVSRAGRHLDTTSCVGHSVGLGTHPVGLVTHSVGLGIFALTECFGYG